MQETLAFILDLSSFTHWSISFQNGFTKARKRQCENWIIPFCCGDYWVRFRFCFGHCHHCHDAHTKLKTTLHEGSSIQAPFLRIEKGVFIVFVEYRQMGRKQILMCRQSDPFQ